MLNNIASTDIISRALYIPKTLFFALLYNLTSSNKQQTLYLYIVTSVKKNLDIKIIA